MTAPGDLRPWPPPSTPWLLRMTWHDLLFAHWPAGASHLRRLVPRPLEIDERDGTAWLGIVPFRMSGVGPRFLSWLPGVSAFPELNVRTYVTLEGKPGVWFFSLDAASRLAVRAARRCFHLPYFDASMSCSDDDGGVAYESRRVHRGEPPVGLSCRYRPAGGASPAAPGTIEDFLTSRYCLYAADPRGRIRRCEIDHAPWPLQPASAEIELRGLAERSGLPSPSGAPLLHFARRLDVVAWRPRLVAGGGGR